MHHSYTHTKRNNTKHRQLSCPSQTNHHPPTHKQQSTKGQKHRHTSNPHKWHQKQNRRTKIFFYTAPNRTPSQYKKQNTHIKLKHLNYPTTTIRTDTEHKQGGGLITLIKDTITFTNINIPKANTHNTELQLIKIHIGKTKDIIVANTYFPPRDTTSSHYNTVDTGIAYDTAYDTSRTYQTQYSQVT